MRLAPLMLIVGCGLGALPLSAGCLVLGIEPLACEGNATARPGACAATACASPPPTRPEARAKARETCDSGSLELGALPKLPP